MWDASSEPNTDAMNDMGLPYSFALKIDVHIFGGEL